MESGERGRTPSEERGGPDLTGRLLVATPSLVEPTFFRTVVLVVAHGDEGAVGVVLNRPTEIAIADAVPGWHALAAPPGVLFHGGPVSGDAVVCVGLAKPGVTPHGFAPFHASLGTLSLDQDPDDLARELEELRFFVGYAGWSPGQLEAELVEDAWFVVAAEPGDPFAREPGGMWRAVLRRQRGVLAMVATMPDDPSLN